MLQDVLDDFAKKISILLDIKDLNTEFISRLNAVFQANKGDNQVTFDVLELETIKKQVEVVPEVESLEEKTEVVLFEDEIPEEAAIFTEEISEEEEEPIIVESIVEVVETKVITSLSMPSRKLKIKISNELLVELEKMQINFRLN
jgi:DNA polymerase-3 subunit alpha